MDFHVHKLRHPSERFDTEHGLLWEMSEFSFFVSISTGLGG